MTTAYHYEDTPPQLFLDQLHRLETHRLYDPEITNEQRLNLIALTRKRLNEWRGNLQNQIKEVKKRYTNDDKLEMDIVLGPYKKLDALGNDITKALASLEDTIKRGRALPRGFGVGEVIFGAYEIDEWHFGTNEDRQRFNEMVKIQNRLEGVVNDLKPMKRAISVAHHRATEQKEDTQILIDKYNRIKSWVRFLITAVILLGITAGMLYGGYIIFNSTAPYIRDDASLNPILGGVLLVMGAVSTILLIVLWRRRNRAIAALKADIQYAQNEYRALKAEAKEKRKEYYPVEQLYKQLKKKYAGLRKSFPRG